jgi:hypothetical protein
MLFVKHRWLALVILEKGSLELFAHAGLKPQFTQSQLPK